MTASSTTPAGQGGPVQLDDLDLDGIAGGFHGGFNYQFGSGGGMDFVIGIEGDVTFTDWNDSIILGANTVGAEGDVDLLASIRGRLGIAMSDVLFYVTGGIAFADADYTGIGLGVSNSVDFDDVGGVIGGGAEWMLSNMISVRGEFLYYIFDDRENTSTLTPASAAGDFAEFEDAYVVRAGISIKLDQLFGGSP